MAKFNLYRVIEYAPDHFDEPDIVKSFSSWEEGVALLNDWNEVYVNSGFESEVDVKNGSLTCVPRPYKTGVYAFYLEEE